MQRLCWVQGAPQPPAAYCTRSFSAGGMGIGTQPAPGEAPQQLSTGMMMMPAQIWEDLGPAGLPSIHHTGGLCFKF